MDTSASTLCARGRPARQQAGRGAQDVSRGCGSRRSPSAVFWHTAAAI